MEPFKQTVVKIRGVPDELRPIFFKSSKSFSQAVSAAISNTRDRSPITGISILLSADNAILEALAISTSADDIFVFYSHSPLMPGGQKDPADITDTLSPLLLGQRAVLVGFGMARIAMHIRHGLNAHVRGIEITEAASPKERQLSPGAFVKNYVDPNANTFAVDTIWDALPSDLVGDASRLQHLALRAWLTAKVGTNIEIQQGLNQCAFVDTVYLSSKHFKAIHQMLVEVEQMEAAKPRVQQNSFKDTAIDDEGNVIVSNDRYNNRVRPSKRTEVWMIDHADALHIGKAKRANGKQTHVAPRSNLGGISFKAIFVVGKDEFSHAERARELFLLHLLQGKHDLREPCYGLIQKLHFPKPNDTSLPKVSRSLITGRLNQSQADVVEAMVNSEAPFVVVHGPPGTGKTSTISAALQEWTSAHRPVWVVAQSNVAVKNIAERLSKDKVQYRLLVSKEFYHEWHENIYHEQVQESLIRTDELPAKQHDNEVLFYGVKVVLCTLSTLSNPSLEGKNIFEFVPVTNLVIDEVSQIGIFNYMHIFATFKRLSKVCFFGDPKQLPPYGKEVATTLQSVFDIKHLKPQAHFLNIQYRMPAPLGSFISDAVYGGKLRSQHDVTVHSCVAFVDASLGEEKSDKKSFINEREVKTVEHIVRHYFRNKDYCVITPYDAQRNLLQKTLQASDLRSDNIYNVDSFQGNEADFIIVSVVRSTSPGFLNSRNRVNVMLTRCRLGMVIVTSRAFMQQRAVKNTLLGELSQHWERKYGREDTWRDWKDVAVKKADLPGVIGRRSKTDSPSEKSLSPTSARASTESVNGLRSSATLLAPVSARLSGASTPVAVSSDVSMRQTSAPTTKQALGIASVTDSLNRMHLDATSPRLTPADSRSQLSRYRGLNANRSTNPSSNYVSDFPKLAQASRPNAVNGAWKNGPPGSQSSRARSVANLPSQKLTSLKKHVPSESLPLPRSSAKKRERLALF